MEVFIPGFDNNTMYADNVDFRGVQPVAPQITADGQLLIGSTATPNIRAGSLTSTGATIAITVGAGTINLEAVGGGTTWVDGVTAWTNVTGTTQALAVNQGYISNSAGGVNFTLPATAAQGTIIKIRGFGAGGWAVTQNASQQIILGSNGTTTSGVGGSVSSTNRYDQIELFCTVANTTWVATWQGNLQPA